MTYKCCECKSNLEWDENCTIEEGLGYYYCSNDDCITKEGCLLYTSDAADE